MCCGEFKDLQLLLTSNRYQELGATLNVICSQRGGINKVLAET